MPELISSRLSEAVRLCGADSSIMSQLEEGLHFLLMAGLVHDVQFHTQQANAAGKMHFAAGLAEGTQQHCLKCQHSYANYKSACGVDTSTLHVEEAGSLPTHPDHL